VSVIATENANETGKGKGKETGIGKESESATEKGRGIEAKGI
jgi:hypothetical protein